MIIFAFSFKDEAKVNKISAFLVVFLVLFLKSSTFTARAQSVPDVERQLWTMAFFKFRLNEKWVYNQDAAYQHSYKTPVFTRFFLRSQGDYQLAGALSLHGGANFLYAFIETGEEALELRPWVGAKVRWPSFWRFNFSQYLRFEQRFQHTVHIDDWDNNFRVRYKVSTNLPINHASMVSNTLYGIFAYEFFSVSFGDDIRFTTASTHRFDTGLGFRPNVRNRYEAVIVALNGRNEDTEQYSLSSVVLFLRYMRFINWD